MNDLYVKAILCLKNGLQIIRKYTQRIIKHPIKNQKNASLKAEKSYIWLCQQAITRLYTLAQRIHNNILKPNAIALKLSALSFSLAIVLFCVCLVHASQPLGAVGADKGVAFTADSIKPLAIGDTIPQALWNLPLQMVQAGQEGSTTVTLGDYKGKLIILDFWGTYCTTCIFNMPHLHALQYRHATDLAVIPVTTEKRQRVTQFLATNHILKDLAISSVIEDKGLLHYFPTQTLPHIVVIDKLGKLHAITQAEYINDITITKLANNTETYIPTKRRGLASPLLQRSANYADLKTNGPIYYAAISPFVDGVAHAMAWEQDTIRDINRFTVSNTFIAKLYAVALGSGLPLKEESRLLAVEEPEHYVFPARSYRDIADRRKHYYSFDAVMPAHVKKEDIQRMLKQQLDDFFQLNGRIETRRVPCLVLKTIGKAKYISAGQRLYTVMNGVVQTRIVERQERVGALPNGVDTYIRGASFADVAGTVKKLVKPELPLILNETGYQGRFDLEFAGDVTTLGAMNRVLRAQGLELVEAARERQLFVLSKKNAEPPAGLPHMTPYGYTYQTNFKSH